MQNDHWNPNQYNKFQEERAKPFWDLAALLKKTEIRSMIDLGCGTGELTMELHERIGSESTLGIDSSTAMLEKAQALASNGLRFQMQAIEAALDGPSYDLVFSNAALQWLDKHEELIPRLLRLVNPEGQIAIQVPANFDHASHILALETARAMGAEIPLGPPFHPSVLTIERYAQILFAHGFSEQRCRMEVYLNAMRSGADIVEWTRGTLLTSYEKLLGKADFARFLEIYRNALLENLGAGAYAYPFKRILIWGKRTR